MELIIALSVFDRRLGPQILHLYPENISDRNQLNRIVTLMDYTLEEGIFTHSFKDFITFNNYFEIDSKWSRGNKEILMVSIIYKIEKTDFDIDKDKEMIINQLLIADFSKSILGLFTEFIEKFSLDDDIFTGVYIKEIDKYDKNTKETILEKTNLIKSWVEELYFATIEIKAPFVKKEEKKCFIISPIGEEGSPVRIHADEVLNFIIKPAVKELKYENVCEIIIKRSDEIAKAGKITDQIYKAILSWDLCIVDLSFDNPNVYYELAIAQCAVKPVIIMALKGTKLPFDLKDERTIFYDLSLTSYNKRTYITQVVDIIKNLVENNWEIKSSIPGFTPFSSKDVNFD